MSWRGAGSDSDHRIIQHGFTHSGFVTAARMLLLHGAERYCVGKMHSDDAEHFQHGMRVIRAQSRLDERHPYAQMVHAIERWVDQILNEVDTHVAQGRIHDAEAWMDEAMNRIASGIVQHFSHELPNR